MKEKRPVALMPDDYVPLNFCRSCGRDFTSTKHFDRHRIGVHAHTYAEGLAMTPPREDGRRCMDADELEAAGLRPMTPEEMQARYPNRVDSGVPLYFDPVRAADARRRFCADGRPVEATRGISRGLDRAA